MWENEAKVKDQTVSMLRTTVERRYKDRDGDWKSSGSFSRNDIPLVIWCLEKAFGVMIEDGTRREDAVEVETIR